MKKMKPILFGTDMVRAILGGSKRMTRRPVKKKYSNTDLVMRTDKYGTRLVERQNDAPPDEILKQEDGCVVTRRHLIAVRDVDSPYQRGDVLYVRETWQEIFETEYNQEDPLHPIPIRDMILNFDELPKTRTGLSRQYSCPAMEPRSKYYIYAANAPVYAEKWKDGVSWRPSIHMPREAARIFLLVTNVRAQRVQEISAHEAILEGIDSGNVLMNTPDNDFAKYAIAQFSYLWDGIYAKRERGRYSWPANPWVWVIEFERISKEEAEREAS